jgi:hypothetical protein
VVAHRAVLQPGEAEVEGLELHPRNPDRCEEVALSAPYDNIAAQLVAETPRDERCQNYDADHNHWLWDSASLQPMFVAVDHSSGRNEATHRGPPSVLWIILIFKNVSSPDSGKLR